MAGIRPRGGSARETVERLDGLGDGRLHARPAVRLGPLEPEGLLRLGQVSLEPLPPLDLSGHPQQEVLYVLGGAFELRPGVVTPAVDTWSSFWPGTQGTLKERP